MSSSAERAATPEADQTLAVGAAVVYGSYGIGRVTHRTSTRSGSSTSEMVVIEFASGLSVTMPFERASACLRPLSGDSEVALVQKTLRSHDSGDEDTWQNRTRSARSKIVAGDLVALAEVVRNAARREGQPTPGGGTVRLSTHERELSVQARHLLATELAISQGTNEAAADEWIEQQLCDEVELTPPARIG